MKQQVCLQNYTIIQTHETIEYGTCVYRYAKREKQQISYYRYEFHQNIVYLDELTSSTSKRLLFGSSVFFFTLAGINKQI